MIVNRGRPVRFATRAWEVSYFASGLIRAALLQTPHVFSVWPESRNVNSPYALETCPHLSRASPIFRFLFGNACSIAHLVLASLTFSYY